MTEILNAIDSYLFGLFGHWMIEVYLEIGIWLLEFNKFDFTTFSI